MKVEAGKKYRTRDGRHVGPLAHGEQYPNGPWNYKAAGEYYMDDGQSYTASCGRGDSGDIVGDVGPVRVVTRTEIVPGVYGAIQITNAHADGVNIHANPGKWSDEDLRAAAAIFIELADALSQGTQS